MIKDDILAYAPRNGQERKDRLKILEYMAMKEKMGQSIFSRECEDMHFTASAWVVNDEMTRGLFVFHNIYNSWSWTGGHADGEEDLLSVAIKEAREETGIGDVTPYSKDPFSLEIIAVSGHEKNGSYVPSHLHLNLTYLLIADEKESITACEGENSNVAWIDLDRICSLSSEQWMADRIYLKLNERLKEMKQL